MELLNRIKKNKKGFTLVEIIVVLVILAILAAFTIPTMLGFVTDAKNKALVAEAREIYVAAQAVTTEWNATHPAADALVTGDLDSDSTEAAMTQLGIYLGSDIPAAATWTITLTGGKVTEVDYTNVNNYVLTPSN